MKTIEELKRSLIIKRAELWVMWSQIRIREREEIQLVAAIKALELKEKGSALTVSVDLSSLDEAALERYRVGKQEAETTEPGKEKD